MDDFGTYLRTLNDEQDDMAKRITRLEDLVSQQQNLITKLQQELIKAGKYANDDDGVRLDGVQIFLKRAGEVEGRKKGRKRG